MIYLRGSLLGLAVAEKAVGLCFMVALSLRSEFVPWCEPPGFSDFIRGTSLTTLSYQLSLKKDSRLATPPGQFHLISLRFLLLWSTVPEIWRWAVGFRKENHGIIKRSPATFSHYKLEAKV